MRYWLKIDNEPWTEVSKAAFVAAERRCGFNNTMGQPDQPATAGFGWSGPGHEVKGKIIGGEPVNRFDPTHHYYAEDGKPITFEQWIQRGEVPERTIHQDTVEQADGTTLGIITVYHGFVDLSCNARLFGTALTSHGRTGRRIVSELEQYDTRAQADAGHLKHLAALRERRIRVESDDS